MNKSNLTKKLKPSWKLVFSLILLSITLSSGLTTYFLYHWQPAKAETLHLDVEISPKGAKLPVNQTQIFTVLVKNGTSPFTFEWQANSTDIDNRQTIEFQFNEPALCVVLSVKVTDSHGIIGQDIAMVFDPVSPSIQLDDLPSESYYVVRSDGTYEWVVKYDGDIPYDGTDDDTVINWALANLPAGRNYFAKVLVMGSFTINNALVVYSWTWLEIDGKIFLAASSNCNMIQNANPSTYNSMVIIEGGRLSGNGGSQSSGHGIYWYTTTTAGWGNREVVIKDCSFTNIKQDAIHLQAVGGDEPPMFRISNCYTYAYRYGLSMEAVPDSEVSDSVLSGDTAGLYIGGSSATQVTNYYGGKIILKNSNAIELSNFFIDMYNINDDGLAFQGSRNCQISNGFIHAGGNSAYNTKSAIKLTSTGSAAYDKSIHNQFSNIYIGRLSGASDTNRFAYGIDEVQSSAYVDYNIYTNIDASDCLSGNRVFGTNSQQHLCWNYTSWES